ncbi:hypothetical protein HHK36_013667 [Tetracentron sinense]|uniref:Glycosyltransferase n=1 Tax=Tetracentron sinense TaxID=13715 RepID=A0A835DHK1_TETSI|nr:hypothetical protein HHK36_013667 [Tetracentron sinense]
MPQTSHQDSSTKPHVIVLAFPFGSHAAPLHTLVRKLATEARHVTFSFFNTEESNSSISVLESEDLDNLKAYNVPDGVPENYVFTGRRQEAIGLFMKSTQGNYKRAIHVAIGAKKISCVMSDGLLSFVAGEMAEEMKVPWVPFWIPASFTLYTHVHTDLIRRRIGTAIDATVGREDELINFLLGMSEFRIGDLQKEIVGADLDLPVAIAAHRMVQMLPRAAAVVINSYEELNPTITDYFKSKFQKCLNVGPFTIMPSEPSDSDQNGCLLWLDGQKARSVAFVSFGRALSPADHEIAALAEALEASGVPFLWSLKKSLWTVLPDGFLERTEGKGKLVSWAPQVEILVHPAVGVFVTHCGWNSVVESVMGRVPMICRPIFADHNLNARMVTDVWRIGVRLEGRVFTRDGTLRALDLIFDDEKARKKMREKMGVIKEMMIKAIGPGGSSSENFKTLLELISNLEA